MKVKLTMMVEMQVTVDAEWDAHGEATLTRVLSVEADPPTVEQVNDYLDWNVGADVLEEALAKVCPRVP